MIKRPLVYPFYAEEHLRRGRTVLRADDPAARVWVEDGLRRRPVNAHFGSRYSDAKRSVQLVDGAAGSQFRSFSTRSARST